MYSYEKFRIWESLNLSTHLLFTCHVSHTTCSVSSIMSHVSYVTCWVKPVSCHMSLTPTATVKEPPPTTSHTRSLQSTRKRCFKERKVQYKKRKTDITTLRLNHPRGWLGAVKSLINREFSTPIKTNFEPPPIFGPSFGPEKNLKSKKKNLTAEEKLKKMDPSTKLFLDN